VTEASDLSKTGILSQYEPDRRWYPLSYYNKWFPPVKLNYDIYDKEMVGIVNCFSEWQDFLMGGPGEIVVFTDHKNLECFNTTKLLNQSQASWAEIFSQFNFKNVYRPVEMNGKVDALARRVDPNLVGDGEKQDLKIGIFKVVQFHLGEN